MSDWSWKLRLFLSADIIGSTAFKSGQIGSYSHPVWASVFKEFFSDFPAAVDAAYEALPPKCPPCSSHAQPWKFVGDEILFNVVLRQYQEAATHLLAFKHAVSTFPTKWREKGIRLKLKATGWLAGFPVTNSEAEVPIRDGKVVDYIGPSMDLGFRIARLSDERRFVVSADLAMMLLDALDNAELGKDCLRVRYLGRESLKGVIGGEPYPVFWIDLISPTNEDRLLGHNSLISTTLLRKHSCGSFSTRHPGYGAPLLSTIKTPSTPAFLTSSKRSAE